MTTIVRMLAVMALMLAASLAQAQNKVPSERALEALVKTTLLTFNDANVTGNYEVFHAKLSKPFREQFPVERLARRFQEFNKKHVDFDIIAALKPSYDPAPKVDDDGKLLVKGYFPDGAVAGLFRSRVHPLRRRMEADPHQRQGRRPEVTTTL